MLKNYEANMMPNKVQNSWLNVMTNDIFSSALEIKKL